MNRAVVTSQARRSGLYAAGLVTLWLAIHAGGIFFWSLDGESGTFLLPVLLLQAWVSTGLFIVAHDCMHGSFAPGRHRLNQAVGKLALGLYAALDYDQLKPAHFLHHRHAGLPGDPDFHAGNPRAFLPWLIRFFRGYYTHAQIVRITLVACLYIFVGGAGLLNVVVFWAVPALLALLQLFYFGTYLPHRHADQDFVDHHRARSNRMGRAASILSCYNFGAYHHEHHLHPEAPWWRLPQTRLKGASVSRTSFSSSPKSSSL